jgi:RHS repeat-associated protein
VIQGPTTTQFSYNGDGDRVSQTINGVITRYAFDPVGLTQVLVETTGSQTRKYVPGLAQLTSGVWAYQLPDGLGSVRQLTDPAGQIALMQSYDPFGNPTQIVGSPASVFGYTGEQTDPTGLVFLRARYYNPRIGRFLTQDPIIPDPLSSVGWNRYTYVGNNPIVRWNNKRGCKR